MSLNITLDLPPDVEVRLRQESRDLEADVKEAYAVELYRQGKLDHFDLCRVLGLDRFETNALLKRLNVFEGSLTIEDVDADRRTFEKLFGKHSQ